MSEVNALLRKACWAAVPHIVESGYREAQEQISTAIEHLEGAEGDEDGTTDASVHINAAMEILLERGTEDWTSPKATKAAGAAMRALATLALGYEAWTKQF